MDQLEGMFVVQTRERQEVGTCTRRIASNSKNEKGSQHPSNNKMVSKKDRITNY